MIIKNKDDNQDNIDYLADLLERDIADDKKSLIEREVKSLYSDNRDEDAPAFYLDSEFSTSKNWMLIHDLRVEHDGEVAQIDHLLIGRMLDVYVIESKGFAYGVTISDEGGFSYFYKDKPYAIASPILQNEQNIRLLDRFLLDNDLLPKRLGITLQPKYRNIVLISPKARLTKPKKGLYDCSAVMKSDKFVERFRGDLDNNDELVMASLANVISQDSLQRFAEKLVLQHKPLTINYVTRFGLQDAAATPGDAANNQSGIPACPVCGAAMVRREAKKGKNVGKAFWGCPQFPKCRGAIEITDDLAAEEPDAETADRVAGPACPKCNGPMVKRVSKKGEKVGREFWGCQDFPKCRGTVPITQA